MVLNKTPGFSSADLESAVHKVASLSVAVIGDLILDRYIWGSVDRISPEAPVPVVSVKKVEDRLGGAANVIKNLVNLGCKTKAVGVVGKDPEGKVVQHLLEKQQVDTTGVVVVDERPTSLKTRVVAHSQQVVRIDREEKEPTEQEQVALLSCLKGVVKDVDLVIVSDYAKGVFGKTISEGIRGLIDKKTPLIVDPHPDNFKLYKNITACKPNRKEAEQMTGIKITDKVSAESAAKKLSELWNSEYVVLSLGGDGIMLYDLHAPTTVLRTTSKQVFDVSGAGDTVTAVFGAVLASGSSPIMAATLANIAAGVVVTEVGTAPIRKEKLIEEIEFLEKKIAQGIGNLKMAPAFVRINWWVSLVRQNPNCSLIIVIG